MSDWKKHWEPEDLSTLRMLFEAGKTNVEIAAAMGRPVGSIARQLTKRGLSRKDLYWTSERNALLKELWRGNVHIDDIVDQLGGEVGDDAIRAQVKRLGMSATRRRAPRAVWTDADDAKLIRLREEGMSFAAIARQMKRGFHSVRERYHEIEPPRQGVAHLVPEAEEKTDNRGKELVRLWLCAMTNVARGSV